jgi:hypothetical protein
MLMNLKGNLILHIETYMNSTKVTMGFFNNQQNGSSLQIMRYS